MPLKELIPASVRKHPWVSFGQILAGLAMFPAFISTVSFLAAVTPDQAALKSEIPIPPGWTAGVMNHGRYYQWWTISERPILFGVSLAVVVVSLLFIWSTVFWVAWQERKSPHPSQ